MPAQNAEPGILLGRFPHRPVDDTTDRQIAELSVLLGMLFLLDIVTTEIILRLGGAELNPAMAGIVASPFVHLAIKAVVLLIIVRISHIAEKTIKGSAIGFYCIVITLYLFVIVNNIFTLIPWAAGF